MIYKKPKNVRYVDMCMYIDNKIQEGNITEEESSVIYQYLYHIIYMLAIKQKYFNKESYYDEFAISLAADVYHRLFTNPKLDEIDENGNPKMVRIKSCLNYIKAILYGRKVAFEQSQYSQKYIDVADVIHDDVEANTLSSFSSIRESLHFDIDVNMNLYFDSIAKTVRQFIYKNSPYRKDRILIKNIYISCMLSIINSLTFTSQDLTNIENKYTSPEAKFKYLCRCYKTNRDNCIILYHIPHKYKNYITYLVRQLYTLIGKDIQELCNTSISIPEDVLMTIALMEVTGKDYYDD